MTAGDIRRKFFDFYKGKDHRIVDSAPLVVKDDPTLMFTNAGMNQFKDYFLGNKRIEHSRIADTQKCLRVSGKHNDLEEVGIDTYHHTMFEMLGNWSFGDYFKEEAIGWAMELLIDELGLPKDRIYATVFGGDRKDKLSRDDESFDIWKKYLPEDRILYYGKNDNFWEMGDTGPCGPCSEIHIDLRSDEEIARKSGKDIINMDHPLVVEIWNLVFIQFNRKGTGRLEDLPKKHVDTGMGLERLAMVVQNKQSNYDTDIFRPLIKFVAGKAGISYGENNEQDIALRVIVDHIRAIAFAIADGQLPSNTGAGYVIRRILRRAVRYGFTHLGFESPFLHNIVPLLAKQFEDVFPELTSQQRHMSHVIKEEEAAFLKTLDKGLRMIEGFLENKSPDDKFTVDGRTIFKLYDTYGFPKDLTLLILRERGFEDKVSRRWEKEFSRALEEQKDRSRSDATIRTEDWTLLDANAISRFVGYDVLETKCRIIRYRKVEEKDTLLYQVVLNQTPFYAESGGQVGDTGILIGRKRQVRILDTRKENNLIVHLVRKLPSEPEEEFVAQVDKERRILIMNNHSATHLMHAALRKVLGKHVEQRGSLVNEKLLRFDFSYFAKMTNDEIHQVESMVNEKIRLNIQQEELKEIPISEAREMGAIALFGEKYGERVRVISFDREYSIELCGGTHVLYTGQIGFFKIISESSIAAGVRRIEASTGFEAEKYVSNQDMLLTEIQEILKESSNITAAIQGLKDENRKLEKALSRAERGRAHELKGELAENIETLNGKAILIDRITIEDPNEIKNIVFQLKNEIPDLFLVLGAVVKGKPMITVAISDSLVKREKLDAGKIVQELATEIKGGGGGQPFYATAGGKFADGLGSALQKARKIIS